MYLALYSISSYTQNTSLGIGVTELYVGIKSKVWKTIKKPQEIKIILENPVPHYVSPAELD